MSRKANHNLTPQEVKAMGLKEFERRFGFRPVDAYEKHFFAGLGERPSPIVLEGIRAGIAGEVDIAAINMAD